MIKIHFETSKYLFYLLAHSSDERVVAKQINKEIIPFIIGFFFKNSFSVCW